MIVESTFGKKTANFGRTIRVYTLVASEMGLVGVELTGLTEEGISCISWPFYQMHHGRELLVRSDQMGSNISWHHRNTTRACWNWALKMLDSNGINGILSLGRIFV